jgi:methylated-DNA-[protein]-cysteine S-methyltransferase
MGGTARKAFNAMTPHAQANPCDARLPQGPLQHTRIHTPLGDVLLAASPRGLCGLWFADQRHGPALSLLGSAVAPDLADAALRQAAQATQRFLHGDGPAPQPNAMPLDLSAGTPLQQQVWAALCRIPSGACTTYGALAAQLGRPSAARAVASAVGRNPISIIVPCHRVLGRDGSLTGYAGGLDRKAALLRLEAAQVSV